MELTTQEYKDLLREMIQVFVLDIDDDGNQINDPIEVMKLINRVTNALNN